MPTASPTSHSAPTRWQQFQQSAQYVGILSVLCAIGFLGHRTHWSFSFNHTTEETDSTTTAENVSNATETSPNGDLTFPSENSVERSGIVTAPIQEQSLSERIRATGEVAYDQKLIASLSSRVPGTVWRVLKHVGDAVRSGDVIALIDSADVGQAKADFLSGLVAVESKEEIVKALERIVGSVPDRQIREARIALRESQIRLHNARQKLTNLGFQVDADAIARQSDVERVSQLQLLGLPADLVQQLDPASTTSNLLPVTASFDGVVIHHDANVGESVDAGKPILEIADVRRMSIRLSVPKENASRLKLGQVVEFRPDGAVEPIHGTITWISTEVDPQTRTLHARADVENPTLDAAGDTEREVRLLRAHTFGTGLITLGKSVHGPVVPVSALLQADHQSLVFIKTGDLSFSRVDVSPGIREGGLVELRDCEFRPGQEVVVAGGHVLKSEGLLRQVASAP
ncbi:MAG: efflux RND transporter periplasmic adaptor subunit [Planctomycetota bacterium]|nr:efflux RND transporter periplasmic adaptor subunit [Planctomycetota bacterium]